MRKPRDFDSELKALDERARQLKARRLQQLGELVAATGAGELPIDILAGALLDATGTRDSAAREGWRARGAAFFQQTKRKRAAASDNASGGAPNSGGTLPLIGRSGPQ